MIPNKNFCILPWIHMASWNDGSVPLCCIANPEKGLNFNTQSPIEIWNSDQYKKARLQFLNGERPSQCTTCWNEEDSGVKSHRMVENGLWHKTLGEENFNKLIESTATDGALDQMPITLDLRLGNTCNLQCVMCRPRDSSKWLKDSKILSEILFTKAAKADWAYKAQSIDNTDVFDWFSQNHVQTDFTKNINNIRHIIFGGGEPLLIKEHERFITKLVQSGASKNIELRYHTNGTILTDKFIDLWSQFKEVELLLSIDDFGIRNDYIRYPANWNEIYSNLRVLDETGDNIKVNILTTIHAMNIYNIPEFAEKLLTCKFKKICARNGGLFSVGTVHWPKYLSTRVLPEKIKQDIVQKWSNHEKLKQHKHWAERICSQLSFMNGYDESYLFYDFMDYIVSLDSIRPIKFSELYSDYYALLNKEYIK